MILFRLSRLKSLTNLLFMLLLVTLAARTEASCVPVVPENVAQNVLMKNCLEMADAVSGKSSSPDHHSDGTQMGLCHLGCPIVSPMDSANGHSGLFLETYVRRLQHPMIGIVNVPQTPPPRFG